MDVTWVVQESTESKDTQLLFGVSVTLSSKKCLTGHFRVHDNPQCFYGLELFIYLDCRYPNPSRLLGECRVDSKTVSLKDQWSLCENFCRRVNWDWWSLVSRKVSRGALLFG